MFKRIRKQLTTNQILHIANLLKRTRRFLTVVAVLAMLLSYVPWQTIKAQTIEDNVLSPLTLNTEGDNTLENDGEQYDSIDIDPSLVPLDFEVVNQRSENTKTF